MIDDEWAVRRPRGFTWWSYRLAQHVEAVEPHWDDGVEISKIRVWTDVATGVDASRDPATWVAMTNAQQTLSALTWDPAQRIVSECCTAIVHEDNVGWVSKLLATAAVLQNTGAHSRARAVAEMLGAEPAVSAHPVSGERPEPDDILGVPQHVFAPAGEGTSAFVGALTQDLQAFLPQFNLLGFSDANGFTCELPFSGSMPVVATVGLAPPGAEHEKPETALLRIFPDIPHPQLGHGALLIMQLPVKFAKERVASAVNQLNLLEATGDVLTSLLGAWCPDVSNHAGDGVAFNAFLPSILAEPNLLENAILIQARRSRFFGAAGVDYLQSLGEDTANSGHISAPA